MIVKTDGKVLVRCDGGRDGTGSWLYFRSGGKWMGFYSEAAAKSALEVTEAPYAKPMVVSSGELMNLLVMDELVDG